MAINVVPVSRQDVDRILKLKEDWFVDVKSIDIAPGKLTKSLSAFANADGGELYIGIDGCIFLRGVTFPGVPVMR